MGLMEKIFGTHSENELKRIYPIVDRIEAMESEMKALSDAELKEKTREFKNRLAEGETLDDILPEAYAVVREAAYRSLGMRHYRVQLIGCLLYTSFQIMVPCFSLHRSDPELRFRILQRHRQMDSQAVHQKHPNP